MEITKNQNKIFFTSDLHFCHNRDFVYKPRGFNSVDEMNEEIVKRWNSVVGKDDDVFVLGDLMLSNNELAVEYINQLNGKLHIVLGNHDTDNRILIYKKLASVMEIENAMRFKYGGYHFFLSHFPCITCNVEKESLKQMTLNLFGHTHSKDKFYEGNAFMYNVALDAHDCTPVDIDTIIHEMKEKFYNTNKND